MTASIASTHPLAQMSTADVLRYLQRGFDAPVQRTLDAHVEDCATCRDELDRAVALQHTGYRTLLAYSSEDETAPFEAEDLAAYTSGTLDADAQAGFEAQIGRSYAAYRHYAAFERSQRTEDPIVPVPAAALARVRALTTSPAVEPAAVPVQAAPSLSDRLAAWTNRTLDALDSILLPSRLAPAGFAIAAVLALIMIAPWSNDSASILVASLSQEGAEITLGVEPAAEIASVDADAETLEFAWEPTDDATGYQVFVTDQNGSIVGQIVTVTDAEWETDAEAFAPEQAFTLNVSAIYTEGKFPVARQTFARK